MNFNFMLSAFIYSFLIFIFFFILGLFVFPVNTKSLRAVKNPCLSYDESVRQINEIIATKEKDAGGHGHTILRTHGHKTEKVVVFYHGFTNCPRQYELLVERFFSLGYNVYVPRYPHHGITDRYTKEIGKLTLKEIMEVCDRSIDLAQGLGEKVTVLGLSLGGVMSAFNAQFRDDIDIAVVMVPSFAWYFLPGIIKPLINFAYLVPNLFLWWDPIKKDKRECPFSMYHYFTTKQMGHIMRLGLSVIRVSKRKAPLTKKILVMTNEVDIAVDELSTKKLIRNWKKFVVYVDYYVFSKNLKMEHDIIDPLHPYAKVDFVYDKILEHIKLAENARN